MPNPCHVGGHVPLPVLAFPRQTEKLLLAFWYQTLEVLQIMCLKLKVKIQCWAIVLMPGLHSHTNLYSQGASMSFGRQKRTVALQCVWTLHTIRPKLLVLISEQWLSTTESVKSMALLVHKPSWHDSMQSAQLLSWHASKAMLHCAHRVNFCKPMTMKLVCCSISVGSFAMHRNVT